MAENVAIRFEATPISVGDHVIVRMPASASAQLGSRGQVAATAVFNGEPFETVLEPDGNRGHWLRLDSDLRQQAVSGKHVDIKLEPHKNWPEPDLPDDFRSALDQAPDLARTWTSITPMARWEWVRWINATRNPQTRQRRVEVSISKLRRGMRRPCCFDLTACTDSDLSKNGKLVDAP